MKRRLPGALQVVRCLLYAFVVLAVVQFDPATLAAERTVDVLGVVAWLLTAGLSLLCALKMSSGGAATLLGIVALQVFVIVQTLLWIGGLGPYPPVPGLLAVVALVLAVLPSARRHFARPTGAY